jgi:hypothetical protein
MAMKPSSSALPMNSVVIALVVASVSSFGSFIALLIWSGDIYTLSPMIREFCFYLVLQYLKLSIIGNIYQQFRYLEGPIKLFISYA